MNNITLILLIIFTFFACNNKNEQLEVQNTILPEKIYEGGEITILAIDSLIDLDLKNDSLFFQVYVSMQNAVEYSEHVVRIKNGKGKFTIPKKTAYIQGFFYTANDKDSKEYIQEVINKENEKIVKNAFIHSRTDTSFLSKELKNNPNNLLAYSQAIAGMWGNMYLGQLSDTVFLEKAKQYLSIVKQNANAEKPSDLQSLAGLYAFSKDFESAEQIILEMLQKYPNSYEFAGAMHDYISAEQMFREGEEEQGKFIELIENEVANKYPNSPYAVMTVWGGDETNKTLNQFSKEDILKNIKLYKSFKPEDIYLTHNEARVNIELGNIKEAKKNVKDYLEAVQNNQFIHLSPSTKSSKADYLDKATHLGSAYFLFAQIKQKEGDINAALNYIDSAYTSYQQETSTFKLYHINNVLNQKSAIQRNAGLYNEALKTYEALYQETKNDRVLDSIKILFKETEQEKGFESYAKNLKERVENQEPKKLAANFSIKDMSGYEIKLSDWKGRVVVLNFWANYCLPCAKEIPFLNKLWRETQTKNIIFLSVTNNTSLEVTRFAQRQKEMFSFSVLPNAKELADVYNVNLVPTQIVINKKGEIVHRETGFGENIDKLKQVVLEELNK